MTDQYEKCIEHINKKWNELTFYVPRDHKIHIGLPNRFVTPTPRGGVFSHDQFYWDSYFIILGLIKSGRVTRAKGMIENFAFLQEKYGIIPSRNRFFNLGISQPPFLSSMVLEIYEIKKSKAWLRKMSKVIEKELNDYWMEDQCAHKHLVYQGLSRYCDHYVNHITAEHESGWDMTSRFNDHCMNYLPVDLNCLLYKYEKDLSEIFKILNEEDKAKMYSLNAIARKKVINKLMWNGKKGFFFDFDYKNEEQSKFYSLAGYYALWSGLANEKQAKKCRDKLRRFEYDHGLANTQKSGLSTEFKQWDYPNGWPNQQWIVIKGLLDYGYHEDAKRLADKWLKLNKKIFDKTGEFWEKYDVVKGREGKEGRYPNQVGFGWTNGVFIKLVEEFKEDETL